MFLGHIADEAFKIVTFVELHANPHRLEDLPRTERWIPRLAMAITSRDEGIQQVVNAYEVQAVVAEVDLLNGLRACIQVPHEGGDELLADLVPVEVQHTDPDVQIQKELDQSCSARMSDEVP